jgi:thiamine-monophosphate kinase
VAQGANIPLRTNAQVGDSVYCSGEIGKAYLGYLGVEEYIKFYEAPMPRLDISQELAKAANAMTDISDGLLSEVRNLAIASNVEIEIDYNKIPFALPNMGRDALIFGDDYELLFTSKMDYKLKIGNVVKRHNGGNLIIVNKPIWLEDLDNLGYSFIS